MISYAPLVKTLDRKDLSIGKLEVIIHNSLLKESINGNRYLSLKTIDSICNALDCKLEDVIEYYPGVNDIREPPKTAYVMVDWAVVKAKFKTNWKQAALMYGKSSSFFYEKCTRPKLNKKAASKIAAFLKCPLEDILIKPKK